MRPRELFICLPVVGKTNRYIHLGSKTAGLALGTQCWATRLGAGGLMGLVIEFFGLCFASVLTHSLIKFELQRLP